MRRWNALLCIYIPLLYTKNKQRKIAKPFSLNFAQDETWLKTEIIIILSLY